MPAEIVPFGGWQRNARLFNDHAELIVTLDVGPRIISYRTLPNGENLFKQYAEQLGGTAETEWKIRGGHRFWIAPEDLEKTYVLDNYPVEYELPSGGVPRETGQTLIVRNPATRDLALEKTMRVSLAPDSAAVTIEHTVANRGPEPVVVAPWALTVMRTGGFEVIPQPPLGEHPRDLLPNRRIVLWAYTALDDPRWTWGSRFFTLRQETASMPTKIGLSHAEGWAGYLHGRTFFFKTVTPPKSGASYPDEGCNFETFSNEEMLEIETLGSLVTLAQGESASHGERWSQHVFDEPPAMDNEEKFAALLEPVVRASGIL